MRVCNYCGQEMDEGYCCGDGEQYFRSDEYLFTNGCTPL